MPDLVIRRMDGTEVHRVPVSNPTESKVERVMLGLLRNMNTDEFFVDESEFDDQEGK